LQEILRAYHIIQITYRIIVSIIILIACNPIDEAVDLTGTVKKDSVAILIERSKDKLLNVEKRKANLRSAYQFNKLLLNDSIKNRNLLKIAFQAYKLNDIAFFKKVNYEALSLSDQLQDTYGIGDAHWNFGNYYRKKEVMDSSYLHYYKAFNSFETANHDYYTGKMLYNMAFIQGRVKDYTGSEISLFKAVSIFKELNKNYNLFLCYDYLRLIYIDLEEYELIWKNMKEPFFIIIKQKNIWSCLERKIQTKKKV
jgi:tetratricopeptide (TPR) repeat protein